ncbi:hypothetical protein DIPPA_12432, partial [Diplonema papillatum]
ASMLELAIDFELFSGLSIPLHENAPKGVRERGNVLRCMISALDKLATQQGLGSCERGERVCPTTSLSFMGISGISGVRPRPRFREAHTGTILEEQVKGSDGRSRPRERRGGPCLSHHSCTPTPCICRVSE